MSNIQFNKDLFNKIMHSIYWQIHHVYKNINFSRISVRNNHAITETLVLYLSDKLFPFLPNVKKWSSKGKVWFEQEIEYQIYPDGTFLILSDMDSLKVTPVFLDSIKSLSQTHLRATYLLDSTSLVITHPLFNDTSEVWIINEVQPNYAVPVVKGDLLLRLQRNDTTQTQHLRHLRRFPTTSDSLKKMDRPH